MVPSQLRVLVLDDSQIVLAAARKTLSDHGWEVLARSNADEVGLVDIGSLNAAILDVEVGDASGIDVAKRLRAARPSLPLAFLTATSDARMRERAKTLGIVFDKSEGLAPVEEWIDAVATESSRGSK